MDNKLKDSLDSMLAQLKDYIEIQITMRVGAEVERILGPAKGKSPAAMAYAKMNRSSLSRDKSLKTDEANDLRGGFAAKSPKR